MTPSRALRTIGDLVLTTGASPFGPGRQSRTPQAQDAIGLGEPFSSTRHIRQLPAIDSRSWKQKRGISAPAASAAWSSVNSGGTSTSVPSTMIFAIDLGLLAFGRGGRFRDLLDQRLQPGIVVRKLILDHGRADIGRMI